jgi:pyruvate/2-oxoglutarate dehydrogenase complex dihydrolipoamide acyltransferase (E2) component
VLIKIAATALAAHPYVNASIDLEREEITLHATVNIGVATATDEGLVVPVIHDAAGRSIAEIAGEVERLTGLAKANRLRQDDLSGGTFTFNNYGPLGIWLGTPIVKPPEVANLGIGAIRDQVVAVDGEPVVRPTVALAVSADHRVLDGHTLAAFVSDVVRTIEQPARLLGGLR